MPKTKNYSIKWNFYVSPIEKAMFASTLLNNGKKKALSAGLRALMHLYNTDKEVQDKLNNIVDDFIVYKEDGSQSIL